MELNPPLTGEALAKRLSEPIIHVPLIESFLYKDASLMVYAKPAIGKSVLSTQIALQVAAGLPVFGSLHVPRPLKVWYIQMERPDIEFLERVQLMSKTLPIISENLVLDTGLQALNFLKDDNLLQVLKRGRLIKPDITFIDPLYGVASGLSKDEVASNLVKVLTIMKYDLKTTLYLNHHPTKDSYDREGYKIEKDNPFYGSVWLEAHITGCYSIDQSETGTHLKIKKDSHQLLLKEILLDFDSESYISHMDTTKCDPKEKYKLFINAKFRSTNRTFSEEECRRNIQCAKRTFWSLTAHYLSTGVIINTKSKPQKALFEVIKDL